VPLQYFVWHTRSELLGYCCQSYCTLTYRLICYLQKQKYIFEIRDTKCLATAAAEVTYSASSAPPPPPLGGFCWTTGERSELIVLRGGRVVCRCCLDQPTSRLPPIDDLTSSLISFFIHFLPCTPPFFQFTPYIPPFRYTDNSW